MEEAVELIAKKSGGKPKTKASSKKIVPKAKAKPKKKTKAKAE